MNSADILTLCEKHNSIELLYKIAREIAESDSIGEGYSYCHEYSRRYFGEELIAIRNSKETVWNYTGVALEIYKDIIEAQKLRGGRIL